MAADLTTFIAAVLREEAHDYPGDDLENSPCLADEGECLDKHVHMMWSVDGVIGGVAGSPEAMARAAARGVWRWMHEVAEEPVGALLHGYLLPRNAAHDKEEEE